MQPSSSVKSPETFVGECIYEIEAFIKSILNCGLLFIFNTIFRTEPEKYCSTIIYF